MPQAWLFLPDSKKKGKTRTSSHSIASVVNGSWKGYGDKTPQAGECYATFVLFRSAQRAFINADNFFLAATLIAGRALVFLGADFPFHFAHRCFMAAEIRLRAAALIVRRFPPADAAFGGLPRLGADEVSPSRAEMARSRRLRSALNSETRCWVSIESFPIGQARKL
jgi:hypothetical protein